MKEVIKTLYVAEKGKTKTSVEKGKCKNIYNEIMKYHTLYRLSIHILGIYNLYHIKCVAIQWRFNS